MNDSFFKTIFFNKLGENSRIGKKNRLGIISIVFFVLVSITSSTFGDEEFESVVLSLIYPNGDKLDLSSSKLVILKNDKIIEEIMGEYEMQYFEVKLSKGEGYRAIAYVDDMYAGTSWFDVPLDEDIKKIFVQPSGGLKLNVFYSNGKAPLSDAKVIIKSHQGNSIREGFLDLDGNSPRFWLSSTKDAKDFYIAEIILSDNLVYQTNPIRLGSGTKDFKITTLWPEIIEYPVTFTFLKDNNSKLNKNDGDFLAELYDYEGEKVSSKITRGEAQFSKLKVGEYGLSLFKINNNESEQELWLNQTLIISGTDDSEILFIKKPETIQSSSTGNENVKLDEIPKDNCNCVAFRLDDVQDFWLNDVQIQVIKLFQTKKIPLTIGIIASNFGEDAKLTEFLVDSVERPDSKLEVANHGLGSEGMTNYDYNKQNEFIKSSNQKISSILNVKPITFIPPQNLFNNDTLQSLYDNQMTHISSSMVKGDNPPYPFENADVYRFPESATTGEYDPEMDQFVGVPSLVTYQNAMDSLQNYGFAVITMHPQEFSEIQDGVLVNQINQRQIQELETLLEHLQKESFSFRSIKNINSILEEKSHDLPRWIKNNAAWWFDGKISDNEFTVGIQFLVDKKIIKIPQVENSENKNVKEIPLWVKTNAKWWSENLISDEDFIQGIQFLLQNGIIIV